jgi:septal ring factor EnvC (AmiA/AmiB activator)
MEEAFEATRREDHEHIRELEAEIAERDGRIANDAQQLSDLRGHVERLDGGWVDALRNRVAALEAELDQANQLLAVRTSERDAAHGTIESLVAKQAETKPGNKRANKPVAAGSR